MYEPRSPCCEQGVVFLIVLLVAVAVYIVGGTLITYQRKRVWEFPKRDFWGGLCSKCGTCVKRYGLLTTRVGRVGRLHFVLLHKN